MPPTTPEDKTTATDDLTKSAIPALDAIAGELGWLRDHFASIKWDNELVTDRWKAAAKLMRALDQNRELAVKVYRFYATDRETVEYLLEREAFPGIVYEPCSGQGHISKVLEEKGFVVRSSDFRDGDDIYGEGGMDLFDLERIDGHVITNPPYDDAAEVAEHLIKIATGKVALLMPLHFQVNLARRPFFDDRPPRVMPLTRRPKFLQGGVKPNSTMLEYGWFLWDGASPMAARDAL
jgi:hypothetical protein